MGCLAAITTNQVIISKCEELTTLFDASSSMNTFDHDCMKRLETYRISCALAG